MTDLGTLGGRVSHAVAVNRLDQVVGASNVGNGYGHGFHWQNGVMRDLGTLGGKSSHAHAISPTGQVVGYSFMPDATIHAFVWQNGVMLDLGLGGASDGQILRRMTAEDQLLWNNLEHLAAQSHDACQQWLVESNSLDQLLDVEPLFDGRTLYFHFLNQASPETDAQLERLVAIFQETVRSSTFSHLLEHGCGPGCGTASATRGCGTACHSCTASKGCGVRRPA